MRRIARIVAASALYTALGCAALLALACSGTYTIVTPPTCLIVDTLLDKTYPMPCPVDTLVVP
jgi:hypothetical protein